MGGLHLRCRPSANHRAAGFHHPGASCKLPEAQEGIQTRHFSLLRIASGPPSPSSSKEAEVPVNAADQNWNSSGRARAHHIPRFISASVVPDQHHRQHFESEELFNLIATQVTTTPDNALVCRDFGPELGRSHVFQIGRKSTRRHAKHLSFTLGAASTDPKEPVSLFSNCAKAVKGWTCPPHPPDR